MCNKCICKQSKKKKNCLNSIVLEFEPVFSAKELDIFKKMCKVCIEYNIVAPELNLNDVYRLYKHILELS